MPTDADKWKQEMIDKGLMKDDDGYYHWTLRAGEPDWGLLVEQLTDGLIKWAVDRAVDMTGPYPV